MHITSVLSKNNSQQCLFKNYYTVFRKNGEQTDTFVAEKTSDEKNIKKKKNIHTAWILALTAFAIADGIWEHRAYKKNKVTNEALQKGKEITDKTLKELEEKTNKLKENLKNKDLELEQLKAALENNGKENPKGEFDKYSYISEKINKARKKP